MVTKLEAMEKEAVSRVVEWGEQAALTGFDKLEGREPSTPRMKRLKSRVRPKYGFGGKYVDPNTKGGVERVDIIYDTYQETQGEPDVIRRAKFLENSAKKMTVLIQDEEILYGYHAEHPDWFCHYPEMGYYATIDLLEEGDMIPEGVDEEELRRKADYFFKLGLQGRTDRYLNPDELEVGYTPTIIEPFPQGNIYSSLQIPYEVLLAEGLEKRIEMAEWKIKDAREKMTLDPDKPWIWAEMAPYAEKMDNWEAMVIAGKAIITLSKRYARLSEILSETDVFDIPQWRREEFKEAADVCWHVPAKPARGFRDAMQSKWFIYMIGHSYERYSSGFSHLEDKVLWPYYRKSVIEKDEQPMTREECLELMEEERLKITERGVARGRIYRTSHQGANDLHILTIAGLDAKGNDASNEVTKLILEAALNVTTAEPSVMMRWHPKVSREVKRLAFECIRRGFGFPSIKQYDLNKWQLINYFGADNQEASDWAVQLCMSPGVSGRKHTQKLRSEGGGCLFPLKYIELMLYDGFDHSYTKMQLGPHSGDATKFKTIDEVFEAYRKQFSYAANLYQKGRDFCRRSEAKYVQMPLISLLDDECLENGVDAAEDTSYGNAWVNMIICADNIDSFAAIEKLVFDEKKYTLAELIEALKADWEGYEEMRQDFLNAPKWGNDDPYVDKWAYRIYHMWFEEVHKNVNYGGYRPLPLPQTVALYATWGPSIGATPNGRKHGEVTASGGADPYMGMDKKGPTAVLNSVAKIPHHEMKGVQLNMRLNHTMMRGDKGFDLWLSLMDAWYRLNLDHIQFNVFNAEDLRAAQETPERYQNLLVRIAGYSVQFISLTKQVQDSIIARTEHEIG
jgi:pyruvate-formate lyase